MAEALFRSPLAPLLATPEGPSFRDLTLAPRAGVKGRGARAWLEGQGFGPLPGPNVATRTARGPLLAMLGESEALLLDPPGMAPLWSFGTGAPIAPGVYPVPRREGTFWIMVSGPEAPDMFATLCAVDLRPRSFADLQVAQTMLAGVSVIIIRDDSLGAPGFHLLGDISLGAYVAHQARAVGPRG